MNYLFGSYAGVNQTQGGYYKQLHDYYNTFKPEGSNHSQLAVQYRWGTIQRSVNKFCGFKYAVDRLHESGKNKTGYALVLQTDLKCILYKSFFKTKLSAGLNFFTCH